MEIFFLISIQIKILLTFYVYSFPPKLFFHNSAIIFKLFQCLTLCEFPLSLCRWRICHAFDLKKLILAVLFSQSRKYINWTGLWFGLEDSVRWNATCLFVKIFVKQTVRLFKYQSIPRVLNKTVKFSIFFTYIKSGDCLCNFK